MNEFYFKKLKVEIVNKHGKLYLRFPFNRKLIEEIKAMDGATWNPAEKVWSIANNRRNSIALDYLAGLKPFEVYTNPLIPIPSSLDQSQLYSHQKLQTQYILTKKRTIIAAEMGVGKTLPLIRIMNFLGGEWWVVSSRSALISWEAELRKWKSEIQPTLITYESLHKLAHLPPPLGIIYDESAKIKNSVAKRSKIALGFAQGIDEFIDCPLCTEDYSTDDRGVRDSNEKIPCELCNSTNQIKRFLILMSGAPAPNNPTDWWHQIETIQPAFLRESSTGKLERRLANQEKMEIPCSSCLGVGCRICANSGVAKTFFKTVSWKKDELEKFYSRLKPIALILKKSDCLDLPPKVYKTFKISPSDEIRQLAQHLIITLPSGIQLLSKLRQLSDGFQYESQSQSAAHAQENPKLDLLKDQLQELLDNGKRRVIIYAAYRASIDLLTKFLLSKNWSVIQVDGRGWNSFKTNSVPDFLPTQEIFQSSSFSYPLAFIAHPQSGGQGLTLLRFSSCLNCQSTGVSVWSSEKKECKECDGTGQVTIETPPIIYFSNDFNADSRIQSEDRTHRIGSRGSVIIDLFHLPTDKLILTTLQEKRSIQSITMGEIKSCLN